MATKNNYDLFATFYDDVQKKQKYLDWKNFVSQILIQRKKRVSSVLDMGCGSLNNGILYGEEGLRDVGIDSSSGLIEIAREKVKNYDIELLKSSFLNLNINESFDLAICHDFTANHILTKPDFLLFLNNAYDHLNNSGILVFDLKPRNDYRRKFGKYMEWQKLNNGNLSYRWQVEYLKFRKIRITLFVKDGKVVKKESSLSKTYGLKEISKVIEKSKFGNKYFIYSNYSFDKPTKYSKFWTFVLTK